MKWQAYARLMRLNKPVGNLLLWYPAAFALWIANQGTPPITLIAYFILGTLVMRAAGCVVNDLADRHIDVHVQRTTKRPVTTGEVGVFQAIALFILLLFAAYAIMVQLSVHCFYYAVAALIFTVIYPFCKRWIQAPQLILSLAFSVSIPMAYTASDVVLNQFVGILLIINVLWVIAYDTMYAMVDREDDLKLGVQSTAVLLGNYDRLGIAILQAVMHLLWLPIADQYARSVLFYFGWGIAGCILVYQQSLLKHRNPADCFCAFQWSLFYGAIMWLSVIGLWYKFY
jgi:4-hydroxybenzoate polyprenyltransferase